MPKKLLPWIGLLLSLALVVHGVSNFDLGATFAAIQRAEPLWLGLAALLFLSLFPLRGLRWSFLLRPVADVNHRRATEIFAIGYMANNILPLRLGDVARALLLSEKSKVPVTSTLSTVLLERIFDGLTVVAFLASVLFLAPPGATWVRGVGLFMGLAFLGGLLFAYALGRHEQRVFRLLGRGLSRWLGSPEAPRPADKLFGLLRGLAVGLRSLQSRRVVFAVLGLSVVVWTLEVFVYALVQRALGLSIPPSGLVLTMALLTLGLTAPSSPGFVGVFEALVTNAVLIYGIGRPEALAFAMTMHLVHFFPGTLLGLYFAARHGLKVRELQQAAFRLETPAQKSGIGAEATPS